jgi:hypothetical protein
MMNTLKVMLFFGIAALILFGISSLAQKSGVSKKAEAAIAWLVVLLVISAFAYFFGFDGFSTPDWSERARR